jgi:cytochrome c551/c552
MPGSRSLWLLPFFFSACHGGAAPAVEVSPSSGFALAERLGCGGCHEGAPRVLAPRLDGIGKRRTDLGLAESLEAHAGLAGDPDLRERIVRHLSGGLDRVPAEGLEVGAIERGRQLYHAIGCVACHEPFEPAESLARPLWAYSEVFEAAEPAQGSSDRLALRGVARRFTRASLAAFLRDPLAEHPDGRMPDLALTRDEAADLTTYLWYEDAAARGATFTRGPGLVLEYFEGSFPGATVDFDALEAQRSEVVVRFYDGLEHREDDYAFRFRGFLEIERAGEYLFSTTSDDGSMLYVDGDLVVDNRGQHAPSRAEGRVRLEPGAHALEVTYFEHMGGDELEVRWQGPGFAERSLGPDGLTHLEVVAPALDTGSPGAADRALPVSLPSLGCAGCHGDGPRGPAFATLRAGAGCLAERPDEELPHYELSRDDRRSLEAAISAGGPPAEAPAERLAREIERLGCGACHARDDLLAGPDAELGRYFRTIGDVDLGDEGRLPPRLDQVGAKLKPAWLREVLVEGARVRPYMWTRMPRFGEANVLPVAELLETVDAPLRDEREPEFSAESVEIGRRLAGTKGLGCIQCHDLAGHPSIGIPAVDLAHVHERIHPGWFRRLMMDPIALKMNTRMPTFWEGGLSPVDVLERDPARQVEALWTYLSLGTSMPLPEGLVPLANEYEVEVVDRPVMVGVFMKDVSPRTVCIGYPERVSIAYDVQNCRLAMAWRGRFLDARGTWFGRAGQLEKPAGDDVIVLPPGPRGDLQVLGRRIDEAGRPVFRYRWNHTVVEESVVPVLRPGGADLLRRFSLTSPVDETLEVQLRTGIGPDAEITLGAGVEAAGSPSKPAARLRARAGQTVVYQLEYSW